MRLETLKREGMPCPYCQATERRGCMNGRFIDWECANCYEGLESTLRPGQQPPIPWVQWIVVGIATAATVWVLLIR